MIPFSFDQADNWYINVIYLVNLSTETIPRCQTSSPGLNSIKRSNIQNHKISLKTLKIDVLRD
jgi:hypothetical protein